MTTTFENIQGGIRPTNPVPPKVEEKSRALSKATPQVTDIKKTLIEPRKPNRMSYEEMFRLLSPFQPPTEEELNKERKKQRREKTFAAIGDGISALSNLFFTTKHAPNMYSGRNTASLRTKERWDKLAAERNAKMTAYMNGLMRARQADAEEARQERHWQRQLGLDAAKAASDEAKEQRDKERHDLDKQLMDGKITEQKHKAKVAEIEEKYAEKRQQMELGHKRAMTRASNARAEDIRNGGEGRQKEELQAAYDLWEKFTPEQKQQWREMNKRYTTKMRDKALKAASYKEYKPDDGDFIMHVYRQHEGWVNDQSGKGKKSVQGFGPGKKKVEGFGK